MGGFAYLLCMAVLAAGVVPTLAALELGVPEVARSGLAALATLVAWWVAVWGIAADPLRGEGVARPRRLYWLALAGLVAGGAGVVGMTASRAPALWLAAVGGLGTAASLAWAALGQGARQRYEAQVRARQAAAWASHKKGAAARLAAEHELTRHRELAERIEAAAAATPEAAVLRLGAELARAVPRVKARGGRVPTGLSRRLEALARGGGPSGGELAIEATKVLADAGPPTRTPPELLERRDERALIVSRAPWVMSPRSGSTWFACAALAAAALFAWVDPEPFRLGLVGVLAIVNVMVLVRTRPEPWTTPGPSSGPDCRLLEERADRWRGALSAKAWRGWLAHRSVLWLNGHVIAALETAVPARKVEAVSDALAAHRQAALEAEGRLLKAAEAFAEIDAAVRWQLALQLHQELLPDEALEALEADLERLWAWQGATVDAWLARFGALGEAAEGEPELQLARRALYPPRELAVGEVRFQ